MKKHIAKLGAGLAAGSAFSWIWSWFRAKKTEPVITGPGVKLLMDDAAVASPSGLVSIEERPLFQVDDKLGLFAMIDDLSEFSAQKRTVGAPMLLEESEPSDSAS